MRAKLEFVRNTQNKEVWLIARPSERAALMVNKQSKTVNHSADW